MRELEEQRSKLSSERLLGTNRALGVSLMLNRISFPFSTGTGKKRREMSINNLKLNSCKKAKSCQTHVENLQPSA